MYICLNHRCKSLFDEPDRIEIERHPYGEGYASEYGCVCPVCGSSEISEAVECEQCGAYHPVEDGDLCNSCRKIEESPYHGCDDIFSVLDVMTA